MSDPRLLLAAALLIPAHIRTVRLLVDAGADVSIADEGGATALEHVRRRGFTEIERILKSTE